MQEDEVKRLRYLEAVNAALKGIVEDLGLVTDATSKLFRMNGSTPQSDRRGPQFSWTKGCRKNGLQANGHL